jgi:hypothetical protein
VRVEFRGEKLCVIAENHGDNARLRLVGADHDRADMSIDVSKDSEIQPAGETTFEPLVIELGRIGDEDEEFTE